MTCAFSSFQRASCAVSGATQNEASSNKPKIFFFAFRHMLKPSGLPGFLLASRLAPHQNEGLREKPGFLAILSGRPRGFLQPEISFHTWQCGSSVAARVD